MRSCSAQPRRGRRVHRASTATPPTGLELVRVEPPVLPRLLFVRRDGQLNHHQHRRHLSRPTPGGFRVLSASAAAASPAAAAVAEAAAAGDPRTRATRARTRGVHAPGVDRDPGLHVMRGYGAASVDGGGFEAATGVGLHRELDGGADGDGAAAVGDGGCKERGSRCRRRGSHRGPNEVVELRTTATAHLQRTPHPVSGRSW